MAGQCAYLFRKTQPVIHIQAEVTVPRLLLGRRAQAVLLTSHPGALDAIAAASEHLTHRLVVQVDMEVRRHLPPFSHVQQSQRHEEGLDLVEQGNTFYYMSSHPHTSETELVK